MRSLSLTDKKGQISDLAPAIIALVFAAIILVLGIIILAEMEETQDSVAVTITNESFNYIDRVTNHTADSAGDCNFNAFTVTGAWNLTEGTLMNTSSYTYYPNDGNIIGTAVLGEGFNGTHWNVSYTYNWGDQACIGANLTIFGMGTFADFWEIIVLAVIIGVVLGILLVIFGGRRRGR